MVASGECADAKRASVSVQFSVWVGVAVRL